MNPRNKPHALLAIPLVLALLVMTTAAGAGASAGPPASAAPDSGPAADSRGFSYAFHYEHVAGTTLRPRDSASGWDYPGVGCVSLANGNELLNINLNLPEGSRIDYLRIYYYDSSANNSTAWITSYNSSGGFTDLTNIASSGTGGYGTRLSNFVGHVVDNADNSYVLNWQANQTGSSMRLCGLRVAYRTPTQDLFLPLVRRS